jgi:uroporphyrinogen decarboxylase
MTPLDILVAAVTGAPAPRIPVFCNLLDQGARELGLSQRDYYQSGENVAEGQLRMRKRFGHDNVWALSYVGKEAEFFGCRDILFDDDGTPNVAEFVISTANDIERMAVPDDITAHPAWATTGRCLDILRREVGGTHPICAYVTASTSLPSILMGMERWMELLLTGPFDLRDRLLAKCSDFVRKQLAAYRQGGANVLIYSSPFGSTSFVGLRRWHEVILPWMRRDLAGGSVADITYYCGTAPFNDVIPTVMDELSIGSYYISPLADLGEAKRMIGPRGLTCGVIDDISMIGWTPERVRDEVRRLCHIGMPGGHFLFGTGVMPMSLPEANIVAMIDAAFTHGRYP